MPNLLKNQSGEPYFRAAAGTDSYRKDLGPWILVATILGTSMAFIDGTAVNVALPVIQNELNATFAGVQWMIETYALFIASFILVGGTLGDYFGRRRMFAIGIVIFTLSSIWCGFAPNSAQLILARAIQGVGGALLVPGSLSIINSYFGGGLRGRAIGTWSGFTAITAGMGPLLGGWLVENISWRWVFFINVPIAFVVLIILFSKVPETRNDDDALKLDWIGAVLTTMGFGGVVYGLIESSSKGFGNPLVIAALVIGTGCLFLFVVNERYSKSPMMTLHLFRSRSFSAANLITFLMYATMGGALFFVPFNLIQVQGYSATAAGAAWIPFILLIFLLSRWAGGVASKHGGKIPLAIGGTIIATGYVLFALPGIGGSYWSTYFPAIFVLGLGAGLSAAPLSTLVMESVDVRQSGLASGINNAISRISGLLAIAVLGIFALQAFNKGLDARIIDIGMSPDAIEYLDTQRIKLAAADVPPGLSAKDSLALKGAIAESFVDAFRVIMFISTCLAMAGVLTALFFIDGSSREREIVTDDRYV
jgi:EmrB/QacA subfamily drug resistance transporter